MANEILPAGVGDLSTTLIAEEALLLAASREDVILNHPAFYMFEGRPDGNVQKVSHVGLMGYDILSAATPGSEIANTALVDGSSSITLARYNKRYNMDDLAKFMVNARVSEAMLAQDAIVSLFQTFISRGAAVGAGFAASVSDTGVDATWDHILAAKATLAVANASGQPMAILHPRQWADLETDALVNGLTAENILGGAITQGLGSYKGRWMGVDFFTSSHVPTANSGADRAGCMFTRGGLVVGYAKPQVLGAVPGNVVDLGQYGIFEIVRQGTYGASSFITSAFIGAALGVEAHGVSIITDA